MKVHDRPSSGSPTAAAAVVSALVGWRPGIATLLALFCWLWMGPAAIAQDSPEIFREISVANLSLGGGAADLQGPMVVRSRYVEIELGRILAQQAPEDRRPSRARGESRKRLTFNLFADAVQEFEEDRAEYSEDGRSYSWYGRSTAGDGQALLVVQDGTVAGSVRTASGEFYRIRSVNSTVHAIRQVIYQGTPAVDDAIPVPEAEVPQAAKAQQAVPVAQQSAAATLDVMVVYTAAARQAAGGASGIQSEVQLAIAELNQSFTNSAVQMQARLVHSAEVSYNEQIDLSTSLARLRTPGDGYMDNVHALRDQYGADVVALLVNGPGSSGGTVGTGYVMQTVGSYFSAYAFSVTEVNFATGPAYALLHEIGHNLGCAHDRAHASSAGAYPYAYGYQRSTTPRFRDIMSYQCSGVNCPTINYWSNPNVNYQGYPTGVSSSASNSADNSQSLNNTKTAAAAWRATTTSSGGGGSTGGGGTAGLAPAVVSVTPSSGSGASRTFRVTVTDGNGYSDLTSVQMVIDQAVGRTNTCHLAYGPPTNGLYLLSDARTTWLGPLALGASGTMSNSQCSVNLGASSASKSGNTVTMDLNLSFSASFAGSKNLLAYALDKTSLNSGWQTKGTWTVPGGTTAAANQAPTIGSVSPSSGSGSNRTFRLTASDAGGYNDMISVQMVIDQAVGRTNTCHLAYGPPTNGIYLLNDARTAWLGPLAVGASGTLANSQCSLNLGASAASGSGTALTLDLNLTFSSGFAGTKNLYAYALDKQSLTSGWLTKGTWTVPGGTTTGASQTPTLGAVSPSSGSGSNRTFRLTASDAGGYNDMISVQMVVDQAVGRTNTCHLAYGPPTNGLYLLNDARTAWLGPLAVGASGTLANSQCSVNLGASAASGSGTALTLDLNLSFSGGFAGTKNLYVYALDKQSLTSGWQTKGTWTVPGGTTAAANQAPVVGSVSPSSGSGSNRTFRIPVSDPNGYTDLISVQMVVDQSVGAFNTCHLAYGPPTNGLFLLNDARTLWMGPVALGSSGTLANSQCSVNLAASSASGSGNTLTVDLNLTFTGSFAGSKNIYTYTLDKLYQSSTWQTKGTWTVN